MAPYQSSQTSTETSAKKKIIKKCSLDWEPQQLLEKEQFSTTTRNNCYLSISRTVYLLFSYLFVLFLRK